AILEKLSPRFAEYYSVGGKYDGMSWWNGLMGVVRNKDVWDKLKLTDADVPLTTDAMFALADRIKSKTTPFIFSSKENYYDSYLPVMMAQYEGNANFKKFLNGVDPDGTVSQYIYTYDGALESLKVFDKLLNKKNNYHSASQASLDFTLMQGQFLSGNALFCLNGSWLENEMKANYKNVNIDFIKTPVISSIINKLPTVNDDKTLQEVVKYIDAVDEAKQVAKPAGVSDADIAAVTEARHMAYLNTGLDEQVIIPSYAKNKEGAKEFLKYMYSDEGLNIYYKTMGGLVLPATPTGGYDSNVKLSTFMQSSFDAVQSNHWLATQTKSKYFVLAMVSQHFNNGTSPTVQLYEGTSTPAKILDANTDAISKKWSSIKQIIG
ncbi:MAG: extracellular solute-binding protein, partial [Clostridia bacterium]|nr:extracellular solute-binding protein [Clostridia bacterium]